MPDRIRAVQKPGGPQPTMTEAEARAALAAFVGVGNVEPCISERSREATPNGWTVPVPLEGSVFRPAPVPGRVRISASSGNGAPAVRIVPIRPG